MFSSLSGKISRHRHKATYLTLLFLAWLTTIFAYAIAAACNHSSEVLLELQTRLKAEFGDDAPGAQLLARANAIVRIPAASSFDEALIDAVRWFRCDTQATPEAYYLAAIRFFQQAGRSHFRSYLIPIIAAWQRNAWTRIVVSETFRLSRPLETVPEIEAALSMVDNDEFFIATLFLAATSAVGATLPQEIQAQFENLASQSKTAGSSDPAIQTSQALT